MLIHFKKERNKQIKNKQQMQKTPLVPEHSLWDRKSAKRDSSMVTSRHYNSKARQHYDEVQECDGEERQYDCAARQYDGKAWQHDGVTVNRIVVLQHRSVVLSPSYCRTSPSYHGMVVLSSYCQHPTFDLQHPIATIRLSSFVLYCEHAQMCSFFISESPS